MRLHRYEWLFLSIMPFLATFACAAESLPSDYNCELSQSHDSRTTMFWGTRRGTPKNDNGDSEFNSYYLFACPNGRNIKRLVLKRYGPNDELIAKMDLPQSSVRKARRYAPRAGLPYVNITSGRCILVGASNEQVSALLVGLTDAADRVGFAHVIFAWKVYPNQTIFEEIPRTSIQWCDGGG